MFPHSYGKLVTCVVGRIYDVVVDLRETSPTYLRWSAAILSDDNRRQMYIPPNCGHGFYTLAERNTVVYCQGGVYQPATERDLLWSDPLVNVYWPLQTGITPVLSDKDLSAPYLHENEVQVNPLRERYLVIGASGQVGGALMEALRHRSKEIVAIGTYNSHPREGMLSFSLEEAGRSEEVCRDLLTMVRPSVIIICAAFTWTDGCEREPEKAQLVNCTAVLNLAQCAKVINSKVVFYSTDYVFPGSDGDDIPDGGYSESSPCKPLQTYGETKYRAEQKLLTVHPEALILRTSTVFGPEIQGKNFVYQLVTNMTSGKDMTLTNVKCTPTYNRDLAAMTLKLIDKGCSGIYHVVGDEAMAKLEFARRVARCLDVEMSKLRVAENVNVSSGCKRPKDVILSSEKRKQELPGFTCRNVEEAIADWLENGVGKPLKA
ncbi:MAT2B [Branchiostoma lanceolatum]|uniref:MAT2B protein n=1 Tax=Branchiostoma lanceolatum TaxID=7740 RepID=A0A8J9ZWP0_BRALA|nr:MAT2B [Branchiostoma lanceolatum]